GGPGKSLLDVEVTQGGAVDRDQRPVAPEAVGEKDQLVIPLLVGGYLDAIGGTVVDPGEDRRDGLAAVGVRQRHEGRGRVGVEVAVRVLDEVAEYRLARRRRGARGRGRTGA